MRNGKHNAGGPYGWMPDELTLISRGAVERLAAMLNKIEDGADWPKGMTYARAAYLAKDAQNREDPLAYRVLLILPAIYRRWASARLAALEDWIAK